MRYQITVSPRAVRQLAKLPGATQRRIRIRIDSLAEDPRPADVKKIAGVERTWRIRVGDYRVLYEIHDRVLTVLVVRVAHRKDAYGDL